MIRLVCAVTAAWARAVLRVPDALAFGMVLNGEDET